MNIKLNSIDVCYFRDSKPFSRGSEHFSVSIFPPNQSTVYNAFRTEIIKQNNISFEDFKKEKFKEEIKKEIGTPHQIGEMKMKSVFLFKDSLYFKLPLDIFLNSDNEYEILKLFKDKNAILSCNLDYVPFINKNDFKKTNNEYFNYFSIANLNKYLLGNCNFINTGIQRETDIIEKDKRVGIGIDSNLKRVKESHFFISEAIEFKDNWSLLAIFENSVSIEKKGILSLGGEFRQFKYEQINEDLFSFIEIEKIKEIVFKTKKFKLLFLSSAIMNNGFLSDKLNNEKIMIIDGIKIKFISCLIDKPNKLGGFDIANNKTKNMYNLIPAGSIYYFEIIDKIDNTAIDKIFKTLFLQNFSDKYNQQGFGLTIIGGITNG